MNQIWRREVQERRVEVWPVRGRRRRVMGRVAREVRRTRGGRRRERGPSMFVLILVGGLLVRF